MKVVLSFQGLALPKGSLGKLSVWAAAYNKNQEFPGDGLVVDLGLRQVQFQGRRTDLKERGVLEAIKSVWLGWPQPGDENAVAARLVASQDPFNSPGLVPVVYYSNKEPKLHWFEQFDDYVKDRGTEEECWALVNASPKPAEVAAQCKPLIFWVRAAQKPENNIRAQFTGKELALVLKLKYAAKEMEHA